jgi:hypothetical protein
MRLSAMVAFVVITLLLAGAPTGSLAQECGARPCLPDRPIPPESVGPIGLPFDVPIWPTLLKTEFHIMPWISLGKVSVCLPGSCKAIEFTAPCFSLKAIPVWIPWLRPLDVDCKDNCLSWVP